MLKLFNTLSKKVEEFRPINENKVGIYSCGPTVYNYPHIGNLRTFILTDILQRVLIANGYEVQLVQNITDIEDKIIRAAKEQNVPISKITDRYTQIFFDNLKELNILPASVNPKATEHINEMVEYIQVLLDKGLAYIEKDGSVYFDISKFSEYGKLSRLDKRELKTGTRVLSDEYSKDNIQDFALWKAVRIDEIGYVSPWGRGRPGWHIECSVMSQKYLGDTFDIHTGGVDLIFPHHENEIAQAEGKTGKRFVNFFVHGEHILVGGQKMSKSLGNFYTLEDIKAKEVEPLTFRYLVLTAHYRDKLKFTWESLGAAKNALGNLIEKIRAWESPNQVDRQFWQRFMDAANNDLNTPQALAVMWELVRSNTPTSRKSATILEMDKILGLNLEKYLGKPLEVPEEIMQLVKEREKMRENENFQKADEIRKELEEQGYEIEDTLSGPKVKKTG